MNTPTLAEEIGRSIIKKQHEFFTSDQLDDLEHITNIKRIIEGIADYLKSHGLSESDITVVADNLNHFGKNLYIELCCDNRDKSEKMEEVRSESTAFYDYIFEHGEYPE
ncbi:MAG: hypothetical protein V1753_01075 [Pseudomonadota bacterium]